MKTKFFILITIIFCISSIISCSKDSDVMIEESKIPQLQFRVQGHGLKLFDSPNLSVRLVDGIVRIHGLESYNSNQDPWGIYIRFPNSIGIHSIAKLNQDDIFTTVYDGPFCIEFLGCCDCPPLPSYQAIEGSISLTQSTGSKVKGTFNFTAERFERIEKIIHSGRFEIEY